MSNYVTIWGDEDGIDPDLVVGHDEFGAAFLSIEGDKDWDAVELDRDELQTIIDILIEAAEVYDAQVTLEDMEREADEQAAASRNRTVNTIDGASANFEVRWDPGVEFSDLGDFWGDESIEFGEIHDMCTVACDECTEQFQVGDRVHLVAEPFYTFEGRVYYFTRRTLHIGAKGVVSRREDEDGDILVNFEPNDGRAVGVRVNRSCLSLTVEDDWVEQYLQTGRFTD